MAWWWRSSGVMNQMGVDGKSRRSNCTKRPSEKNGTHPNQLMSAIGCIWAPKPGNERQNHHVSAMGCLWAPKPANERQNHPVSAMGCLWAPKPDNERQNQHISAIRCEFQGGACWINLQSDIMELFKGSLVVGTGSWRGSQWTLFFLCYISCLVKFGGGSMRQVGVGMCMGRRR